MSAGYSPAPPREGDGPAYDPAMLPAREDGGSRFALSVSAAGWPVSPAENVAKTYRELVGQRVASVPSLEPKAAWVSLMWADANGIRDRGTISLIHTRDNVRPTKIGKCQLKGGALLDSLFLGGEAWEKATDRECFVALADLAFHSGLTGAPLRKVNDALCRLLLGRAGMPVSWDSDLPNGGGR